MSMSWLLCSVPYKPVDGDETRGNGKQFSARYVHEVIWDARLGGG